jgi:hypothetical protein
LTGVLSAGLPLSAVDVPASAPLGLGMTEASGLPVTGLLPVVVSSPSAASSSGSAAALASFLAVLPLSGFLVPASLSPSELGSGALGLLSEQPPARARLATTTLKNFNAIGRLQGNPRQGGA